MAADLMETSLQQTLEPYLKSTVTADWSDGSLAQFAIKDRTPCLEANSAYFSHPEWAQSYFEHCHRSPRFASRWRAATGSWDDKIVVDLGCGPGNVFATLGGKPRLLLGVDVARGSLQMASKIGYVPVLADAHDLPFVPGFADLVVLNATLHHCDDMPRALAQAALLVAPGGLLVTDHDPQLSAWDFRGLAKFAWDFRLILYRLLKKGFHRSRREQSVALASEIHHEPGRGVTAALYHEVLTPRGFAVELFPHNHNLGGEVLAGQFGRSAGIFRIAQRLSGIDPDSSAGALSILCRARRTG